MPPPGQQPSPSQQQQTDPGLAIVGGAMLVVGLLMGIWHIWHEPIAAAVLGVRFVEAWVVRLFTGQLRDVLAWISATPAGAVEWSELTLASRMVGEYLRWPAAAALGWMAYSTATRSSSTRFRRRFDLEGLIRESAKVHPAILPIVDDNPAKDASGRWAEAMDSLGWLKAMGIAEPESEGGRASMAEAFSRQLTANWTEPNQLPLHVRTLYAMFCLKASQPPMPKAGGGGAASLWKRLVHFLIYFQPLKLKVVSPYDVIDKQRKGHHKAAEEMINSLARLWVMGGNKVGMDVAIAVAPAHIVEAIAAAYFGKPRDVVVKSAQGKAASTASAYERLRAKALKAQPAERAAMAEELTGLHDAAVKAAFEAKQAEHWFSQMPALIDRILADPSFAGMHEVTSRHAYVETAMASAIKRAREMTGKLPSSWFIWLKVQNRGLFYVLNNVGRRTYHAEASGAMAHWKAELKEGHRLIEPQVGEALAAVYVDLTLRKKGKKQ